MGRVDPKLIDKLVTLNNGTSPETKSETANTQKNKINFEKVVNSNSDEITIDALNNIDLRIGRILAAAQVDGADKLLRLTIDLGNEKRQIFAGIKSAYAVEDLKNKLVVVVANLKARKMRFGESQGMVLAASGEDSGIFLISPDSGAIPGMRVK